jgi:hypothetical protein
MEDVITNEYTELAQSYMAQALMVLGLSFSMALSRTAARISIGEK